MEERAAHYLVVLSFVVQHKSGHQSCRQPIRSVLPSAHLPEPAAPDLLQVQQIVAAHLRGLEELDWGTKMAENAEF